MVFDEEGELISIGKQFNEDFIIVDFSKIQKKTHKKFNEDEEMYNALVFGIREYFSKNNDMFYFLFDDNNELIGNIFFHSNFIQSLCVNRKFQRKGYGSQLTKFAVNKILDNGYDKVVLKVLGGNDITTTSYKYGVVSAVRFSDSGTKLVVDGSEYNFSDITEIINPST